MAGHTHVHSHDHGHPHDHGDHGHSHGLVDRSIMRSREGIRAVLWSLAILGLTALTQAVIFLATGSVALLADLIHNIGDAATAIPVGIAFLLRSFRAEKIAGLLVVLAILASACVALYATIQRRPSRRAGGCGRRRLPRQRARGSCAASSWKAAREPRTLVDGNHARVDGFVSLGVVVSAVGVWLGFELADPLVGLVITLVILKITWDSWHTVRGAEPGEGDGEHSVAERL